MKKLHVDGIGEVVYWNDFILSRFYKKDGEPINDFKQSNTKLDGYCYRTIGVTNRAGGYIISVALSKEELTAKTEKSGKGVVVHRIKKLINQGLSATIEDKGVTWVPHSYVGLLYNDPVAYNNIFGPIDVMSIKMAIASLNEATDKAIDMYYKNDARRGSRSNNNQAPPAI